MNKWIISVWTKSGKVFYYFRFDELNREGDSFGFQASSALATKFPDYPSALDALYAVPYSRISLATKVLIESISE